MNTSFDVTIYWDEMRDKIMFRTLREYSFEVMGRFISVPDQYETDFASIPQFLHGILPALGKHCPAALVHDWLYDQRIGTRREADEIFLKLMLDYDVPSWRAYTMYYGVRMFGKSWWKN